MALINIFWFRRDLRLEDNVGLFHALSGTLPVLPIFIFDINILDKLDDKSDGRVQFIQGALDKLQSQLVDIGSSLEVFRGKPVEVFTSLIERYEIGEVYANHDYEPYSIDRDLEIQQLLLNKNIGFQSYKDQVIFEKDEVMKGDGSAYSVFTPYSNQWKMKFKTSEIHEYPSEQKLSKLFHQDPISIPTLSELGFEFVPYHFPSENWDNELIRNYQEERNFPFLNRTSKLGVHLRFGTVGIRKLILSISPISETFLNELIWREFFQMVLFHFPHVARGYAFRSEYENIRWRNSEAEFESWCNGQTGYPIVDAGMRELNQTGFMHNRVRMITASFLTKHLLIDWRWGEAYFASKLLDFEFASNNGNWQWVAGSGCDAAPYFRIFNPALQAKKFDPKNEYIKKWVPEFEESTYCKRIVEQEFARDRALKEYSRALKKSEIGEL